MVKNDNAGIELRGSGPAKIENVSIYNTAHGLIVENSAKLEINGFTYDGPGSGIKADAVLDILIRDVKINLSDVEKNDLKAAFEQKDKPTFFRRLEETVKGLPAEKIDAAISIGEKIWGLIPG